MTDNEVYAAIADCLLALKGRGATYTQLEDGIARAAKQAGIRKANLVNACDAPVNDWREP